MSKVEEPAALPGGTAVSAQGLGSAQRDVLAAIAKYPEGVRLDQLAQESMRLWGSTRMALYSLQRRGLVRWNGAWGRRSRWFLVTP